MTFLFDGAKVVFRQKGESFDGLEAVVRLEAVLQARVGDADHVRRKVERTIGLDEMDAVVLLEQLPE